jgi:hypothetical protein
LPGIDDCVVGIKARREVPPALRFGRDAHGPLHVCFALKNGHFGVVLRYLKCAAALEIDLEACLVFELSHKLFIRVKTAKGHRSKLGLLVDLTPGRQHAGSGPARLSSGFPGLEYNYA